MKSKLSKYVKRYNELEKKILKELEMLENYGLPCDCGNREVFYTIGWNVYISEDGYIEKYCLNCGGDVVE